MEALRVHRYCILYTLFVFITSTFFVPSTVAYDKKLAHQERIAVDYLGTPYIDGDEYAAAIQRAQYDEAANKVKRQNVPDDVATSTEPYLNTQSDSPLPTEPSSPSTVPEIDNMTFSPTPSSSPPTKPSSTSPEQASSSSTTTTTTTEPTTPSTTTTTEEPPQLWPPGEGQRTKGYFCLCDYQVKVCDMNCCCDPDCTDQDKKELFKRCDDNSRIYDPSSKLLSKEHSCVKSYIMYQENIPYRTERKDKNLLCIVKENAQQVREFSRTDMTRIARRISHGQLDTRPKYTWDSLQKKEKTMSINYNEPYKYGSAIWYVRPENENGESKEAMFRLPAALLTDACSVLEPVKYLQDSESRCVRPLYDVVAQCETLRQLNANHFIKDQLIITNPTKQGNWTDVEGKESIIPVTWCYNTLADCKSFPLDSDSVQENGDEIEFPAPALGGGVWNTLHIAANKCTNVLSQLNLTFIHEGIHGITKIFAKALLIDVPVGQKEIVQEFRTDFIWRNVHKSKEGTNDTNSTLLENWLHHMKLPRSGNPGYIVGKPLILGRKVITEMPKNETDGKSQYAMHVLPDASKWLQIQGAGDCPLNEKQIQENPRHSILFGYEHVSSCKLPLDYFRYCEDLQRHIASIIFGFYGETHPSQFTKSSLYVAAYGSPDAFPSDWVQLKFVEISSLTQGSSQSASSPSASHPVAGGCGEIVASAHITVSFAYVGPVDSPQAKITGIFYEPEPPISIPEITEENKRVKNIAVTTTVSFLDVTSKPTTRVGTFPVVSIKLPKDFFYPFSSSTTGPLSGGNKIGVSENYHLLSSSLTLLILYSGTFVFY